MARTVFFLDSDGATNEQISFISKVKRFYDIDTKKLETEFDDDLYQFRVNEELIPYETEIYIPKKFQHVDLEAV